MTQQPPRRPPPPAMSPADVAALTEACQRAELGHQKLRAAINDLDAKFVAAGHTPRLMAPWAHFTKNLTGHMQLEEATVFPALIKLAAGEEPESEAYIGLVHEMQFELDEIRTISDALRNAALDAGPDERALLELLDHLETHAAREEDTLYPLAVRVMEAWATGGDSEPPPDAARRVLRETTGRCHTCLQAVPAQVVHRGETVFLEKTCEEHGMSEQLLSRSPAYWADLDRFYFKVNSEDYKQRDYIVRMTENCNLDCPICLAKANTEDTPDLDLSGLEDLLSERRGIKVDLMAAEPTLREDLEDWIRKVKATGNIAALHTNGLKLANLEYARKLKAAGVDEVFLQFDGFNEEANKVLRGRPLIKARMKALENMKALDISTSLIVVVARGLNEEEVSKTYRFALQPENSHIREVFFLGLRMLGSARDSLARDKPQMVDMAMMPDELIDVLCNDEESITREDVRLFNKLYFALLSAFKVKKCLYVQHYLVTRDGKGGFTPVSQLLNLPALGRAAERYGERFQRNPHMARAGLLASLSRHGVNRETAKMLLDLVRLQMLFKTGMNLRDVPRRFLLLGFITACDPHNFDSEVAINCGKGELSSDGGFVESGAVANVRREARFEDTALAPGDRKRKDRADRTAKK